MSGAFPVVGLAAVGALVATVALVFLARSRVALVGAAPRVLGSVAAAPVVSASIVGAPAVAVVAAASLGLAAEQDLVRVDLVLYRLTPSLSS
jgi:hypothetical protein